MTVVVTAIFEPVEGQREQLVAALQQCIPAVHQEQGCLLYAIHDAAITMRRSGTRPKTSTGTQWDRPSRR